MRRKFVTLEENRWPVKGDLIRSSNTCNYINIVLETTEIQKNDVGISCMHVRSVRYGSTKFRKFILLNGRRSRWITLSRRWPDVWPSWEIVEEFGAIDNSAVISEILKSLDGVDTTYRPQNSQANT